MTTTWQCPVCGWHGLLRPPYEIWPPPEGLAISPPYEDFLGRPTYEVCGQCGFEFGFDDNPGTGSGRDSFESYRAKWEADGRPWFDRRLAPGATHED